jgi:hypothetical protein
MEHRVIAFTLLLGLAVAVGVPRALERRRTPAELCECSKELYLQAREGGWRREPLLEAKRLLEQARDRADYQDEAQGREICKLLILVRKALIESE